MVILDGKKLANKILDRLEKEIKKLLPIRLVVVLVGKDPASLSFIKQKQKTAEKIGIQFKLYKFKKNISKKKLIEKLTKIVKNKTNTGIVVQLPLPKHINQQEILNIILPKKDVDALNVDNFLVEPPAASGIIEILKEYNIRIKGKRVIIIGKGTLVGKPLAVIMKKAGANSMVCDSKTKNLNSQTLKADILISATGKPCLVKKGMVKKGAVVIDAGFSKRKGEIIGDVDFEKVKKKTSYITPVPGGVGPMTVAMLISNLVKLAKKQYETP